MIVIFFIVVPCNRTGYRDYWTNYLHTCLFCSKIFTILEFFLHTLKILKFIKTPTCFGPHRTIFREYVVPNYSYHSILFSTLHIYWCCGGMLPQHQYDS